MDLSYRFGAGRYIQEENALDHIGEEILRFGKKPYFVGSPTATQVVWKRIEQSLAVSDVKWEREVYSGYPSFEKIEELKQSIRSAGCDLVVGIGGGRILDLAKAAAAGEKLPIMAVPTSAATCAAFSPLSVIYTREGRSDGYIQFDQEVSEVIVDSEVMMTQPVRLLAAGILDAMAKYIEIGMLHPRVLDEETTIARHSAYYMAEYTYRILWEKGKQACEDLENQIWTKDLNDIIYINIALTGIVSAMMQGRGQTALGHGMNSVLRKNFLETASKYLHGELVAIGLLTQLVYNGEEDKVPELKAYMESLHMPCSLFDVGLIPENSEIEQLLKDLCDKPFMKNQNEERKKLLRCGLQAIIR